MKTLIAPPPPRAARYPVATRPPAVLDYRLAAGCALAMDRGRPVAIVEPAGGRLMAEYRPGYQHALPRLIALLRR